MTPSSATTPLFATTEHQHQQLQVIASIEASLRSPNLPFSVVEPVADFKNDTRMALTTVHFLKPELVSVITDQVQAALQPLQPNCFWYGPDQLHFTIKNIKTIAEPPEFTDTDAMTVQRELNQVMPSFSAFRAYYYRLLLFPQSLALIGTTDPEFDELFLALDAALNRVGVPDNKQYLNQRYFFSNITLARFTGPAAPAFKQAIEKLSANLNISPYLVDSVTLLSANAAMFKQKVYGQWQLPLSP